MFETLTEKRWREGREKEQAERTATMERKAKEQAEVEVANDERSRYEQRAVAAAWKLEPLRIQESQLVRLANDTLKDIVANTGEVARLEALAGLEKSGIILKADAKTADLAALRATGERLHKALDELKPKLAKKRQEVEQAEAAFKKATADRVKKYGY